MKTVIISCFPPDESGIAEFTQDFINAYRILSPEDEIVGVSANQTENQGHSNPLVQHAFGKHDIPEYAKAAEWINSQHPDRIILQHEFSIYGGDEGDAVIPLIEKLAAPVFLFAHTVPVDEDAHNFHKRKEFFTMIRDHTTGIVTFLPKAKEFLAALGYGPERITVIPHPVPDIKPPADRNALREALGLPRDAFIYLSFGFFHPNKGTLHAVKAAGMLPPSSPVFLTVIGTLLQSDTSRTYYEELNAEVSSAGGSRVRLINRFMPVNDLFSHIQAADAGLVTYIYRSYTASGPLSFFIGAGKPVIVTPFAYATSILTDSQAVFVPFEDPNTTAKAMERLASDAGYYRRIADGVAQLKMTLLWDESMKRYCSFFDIRNLQG